MVLTLASSLKVAGTLSYYALFTDDFIDRYCVNKERPELHCDGKCYLAKMLLQESNDDHPPINIELLKNETILFLEKSPAFEIISNQGSAIANYQYNDRYEYCYLKEVTHPPRL
ncbi:hypothetical protein [Maribacter polysaccharolyticus]|uniref:hypothetical protein n=1 Tax=Maribacter polysaccharolyticus TaxID=3020831 RepID=UPI00237F850C|nr:hypothetical protein [Maribacter polysaccharolyticus]MDE3740890.1 hypothetical protein [Maribacter polysaccharolyticus]